MEKKDFNKILKEREAKVREENARRAGAAGMTLEETQIALTLYGMARLYARIPRDAVLMIAFNRKKCDVLAVNALLSEHGMEPLRPCGGPE